jgi:hypothetical protein
VRSVVVYDAIAGACGLDRDVLIVETYGLSDESDAAYRTRYRRYAASIDSIVIAEARAAMLKLVPR